MLLALQDVIVGERRFQYEAEVKKNPLNYDSWFDYIRLEEAAGDYDKIREVCTIDSSAAKPCHVTCVDALHSKGCSFIACNSQQCAEGMLTADCKCNRKAVYNALHMAWHQPTTCA